MKHSIRLQQNQDEQENKIATYIDKPKQRASPPTPHEKQEENDNQHHYTGRIENAQKGNLRIALNRNCQNKKNNHYDNCPIDNPFCKLHDRHYGSFKSQILGNYKKIFDSLDLPSTKPFGRHKTIQRKILKQASFTAIIYSSGTIEFRVKRYSDSSRRAIGKLQAQEWQTAIEARVTVEKLFSFALSGLVKNRPAKYGVEDAAARSVNLELEARLRKMDSSVRVVKGRVVRKVPHVDNFGASAAEADARLSEAQHDALSSELAGAQGLSPSDGLKWRKAKGEARLAQPEILKSIESAMLDMASAQRELLDSQKQGAENIRFFGENMKSHVAAVQALARAAKGLVPKREKMPTAFRNSATVKGLS